MSLRLRAVIDFRKSSCVEVDCQLTVSVARTSCRDVGLKTSALQL